MSTSRAADRLSVYVYNGNHLSSFTGCRWSPLPLLLDDITELVDVRDLALLHHRLRTPHSSPLPSASLARQWLIWRCVCVRYHVGILPCGPGLRREGILLCFSMSQYMLAFMVPSMNCSSPAPAAPDHDTPTTMLDCRQDTLVFVLLTWLPPHTLDII